jgi:hypothetical protein
MQLRRALAISFLVLAASARPAAATDAPGTQTVARLQNFETLIAFLNLASGAVRLVVILEPSEQSSADVLTAVQSVLEANASKRLRVFVVWSRLGPDDTELRALARTAELRDRRLVCFWDGGGFVASSFRGAVGSKSEPVTGTILLYDTDARLAFAPPAPSLWMSVNPALAGPALDASALGARTSEMVRRVEAKVTDAAQSKP